MRNFLNLIKIELIQSFTFKGSKKKKIGILTGLILFCLLFLFISVVYNMMFYMSFKGSGAEYLYPLLISFILMITILATSINRSKMILFSNKDYNILTPLPLKRSTIVASKLTLLYLEELVFSLIIFLPTIILYSMTDIMFILMGMLLLLTIPLFTILISSVLGFLISLITTRFNKAKIIGTILYILMFIGVMAFVMLFNIKSDTGDSEGILNITESIYKYFPLLILVEKGFLEHNLLYLSIYLLVAIVSTATVIFLYAAFSNKFYLMLEKTGRAKEYKRENIKTKGLMKSLILHDLKQLFSNSYALLNTLAGAIVSIVMIVVMVIQFENVKFEPGAIEVFNLIYQGMFVVLIVFGAMSSYTACSINIEKDNFWIMKTMPIPLNKIIYSKLIVNQIIVGSATLISSIIVSAMIEYSSYMIVLNILFPQIYIFMASLYGMFANLLMPKLNWSNVNQFKNAPSMILYTFPTMFFSMILAVIVYICIFFANIIMSIVLAVLITLILIVVFSLLLKYNAKKLWLKIEA